MIVSILARGKIPRSATTVPERSRGKKSSVNRGLTTGVTIESGRGHDHSEANHPYPGAPELSVTVSFANTRTVLASGPLDESSQAIPRMTRTHKLSFGIRIIF